MQTTQTTYTGGDDTRRRARRGLAVYFGVVVLLSAPIEVAIIYLDLDGGRNGLGQYLALIATLMFVPTMASVAARLALREGFSDVSFRLGGRRGRNAVLQALVFPIIVGLVAYGLAWATGLIGFGLPPTGLGGWAAAAVFMYPMGLVYAAVILGVQSTPRTVLIGALLIVASGAWMSLSVLRRRSAEAAGTAQPRVR